MPLVRALQYSVKNIKSETEAGNLLQNALLVAFSRSLGSLEQNEIVAKGTITDPSLKKTAFG